MPRHRLRLTGALLLGSALLVTACSEDSPDSDDSAATQNGQAPAAASVAPSAQPGAFPATVTNCGRTFTFLEAPERIVSIYPSMTEVLLALGAGDRVVGQANTELAEPLPEYAAAAAAVPVLAEQLPSKEALLTARPQLIVADGEYWFDGKQLPTYEELDELGIQVFINSAFCDANRTTGTLDNTRRDITDLGAILGVPDTAATLAAGNTQQVTDASTAAEGKAPMRTAVVSIFEGQIYANALTLIDPILTAAGASNIYTAADLPDGNYYGQISEEDLLKRAPEAIVISYSYGQDRKATADFVATRLADTPAVRNGKVIEASETYFAGELRSAPAITALARGLHGTS